jgi:molecular chaperone DnaJ
MEEDPFTVLGVPRGATQDEAKKRYLELVKQWHPDTFQDERGRREAEAQFKKIQRAFTQVTEKYRSPGHFRNEYVMATPVLSLSYLNSERINPKSIPT